jgi:hypothetical protein
MSCWNRVPSPPNDVGSVARMICSLESAGSSTKSPSVASTIVANAFSGARAVDGTWHATFHSPDGDRTLAYVTMPTHSKLPYAVPCRSNATPARAQQRDTNSAASRCRYLSRMPLRCCRS